MFDSCRRDIHYLRLSVTDRCNLRCRYCMPDGAKIPEHEEVLTHEEFLRLAALFAQCGIDTVRVTGGEPLVRKSVAQLVAGLKATPGIRHVSMTTNGTLLAQQLPALLDAGLDSVNISLDTLDPAVFRHITARDEFAAVQAGLRAALESPLPVKLNCVPQVGVNEGELEAIAALARDNDLQVRFIEMMPIGYGAAMPCVSGPELRARFANRWPELHPVEGTTFGNGPAVYYTVPGWKGSIGFIAAVHGKFCVSCNRVRLTSQGFLRPCLASETGCDLRALRYEFDGDGTGKYPDSGRIPCEHAHGRAPDADRAGKSRDSKIYESTVYRMCLLYAMPAACRYSDGISLLQRKIF